MDEARFRTAEAKLWASEGVTPAERTVRLPGPGTAVRVQEVGEGPPVVFIHGGSNSGASWAGLVARLDGFRCLVLDRPGCGLSEPLPEPFPDVAAFEAFADRFLADVLDGLGLASAHVVATSFGGLLAVRSAAAHPERVDRLVLCGWSVGAPTDSVPLVMRIASLPGVGRLFTAVPPTERSTRSMLKGIGLRQAMEAGRVSQEAVDWFHSLLRDTDTMRNELRAGPRIMTMRGMDDRILLPADLRARVQAPTYLLWGEEDPLGGPDVARPFAEPFPDAQLELVPGAGHAVWMDDAERTAKVVGRFLQG